mmetsp:Transcript_57705/g.137289  ORF Transcript_57705/g.137289 Transcript_57705/m.137289 type:complete len:331 (+) Transcript_57705:60-1052(+)|eukprot:CAMPEP_0178413558 /NCGR_PEP_ID=MMETSP0689_2-20121128/22588_1 /TAXON_ID=160604 /ORGANISM="Amphidinium massartii, Strain CS-259" /LENGTH=330 /DNA_ID=CAMNT_0020034831 /DNA_START=59 /DNA_END=1051 /DNA_ORIENTATION=+
MTPPYRSRNSSRKACSTPLVAAVLGGSFIAVLHCLRLPTTWNLHRLQSTGGGDVALVLAAAADKDAGASASSGNICQDAVEAGLDVFSAAVKKWQASTKKYLIVKGLSEAQKQKEKAALSAFESTVGSSEGCESYRDTLLKRIRQEAAEVATDQLVLAERIVEQRLREQLLTKMEERNNPLRIQEKLEMLQRAVADFKKLAKMIAPSWAEPVDTSRVEKLLGELCMEIERSVEGQQIRTLWENRRIQQVINDQGPVSWPDVKPSLHVMLRPEGFGALQIYTSGPIGPPYYPATMHIGILNDGSIADVYREHPTPPLVSVQPKFDVDMKLR